MAQPLTLSVIMPNYNHAEWIGVQLKALLGQSRPPDEIIVIDDGSTDESVRVIEDIAKGNSIVRLLRNDSNLGVVPSVERGLKAAIGNCLYFAASDDIVLPGFFAAALEQLSTYPQAAFCFSVGASLDLATGRLWCDPGPRIDASGYLCPGLIMRQQRRSPFQMHAFTAVIKTDAFYASGGAMPSLGIFSDSFLQFAMAYRYGVCYVADQCFALWRISGNSYSQSVAGRPEEMAKALNTLLETLRSEPYAGIRGLFRDSGSLWNFRPEWSLLHVLLHSPHNRQFLTPLLLRRLVWNRFRRTAGSLMPLGIKTTYRYLERYFGTRERGHRAYLDAARAELQKVSLCGRRVDRQHTRACHIR